MLMQCVRNAMLLQRCPCRIQRPVSAAGITDHRMVDQRRHVGDQTRHVRRFVLYDHEEAERWRVGGHGKSGQFEQKNPRKSGDFQGLYQYVDAKAGRLV